MQSNADDVLGPGHVGLRLHERLVEASVEHRLLAFSFICSPFIFIYYMYMCDDKTELDSM